MASRSSATSWSSSSSAEAAPPPALPSREAVMRRRAPPPLTPMSGAGGDLNAGITRATSAVNLSRSSSMDRKHFIGGHKSELSLFPKQDLMTSSAGAAAASIGPAESFSSSGRHTHLLHHGHYHPHQHAHPLHAFSPPTKEALHEHNMKNIEPNRRELEELRVRCSQMEKTMRWWSDCTANWRDKWSKVRAERNKLKDDVKRASAKLEDQQLELTRMARENERLARMLRERGLEGDEDRTRGQAGDTEDPVVAEKESIDLTVTSANFLTMAQSVTKKCRHCGTASVTTDPGADSKKATPLSPSLNSSSVDSGFHVHSASVLSEPQEGTGSGTMTGSGAGEQQQQDQISRFLNDAVQLAGSEQANMLKFRLDEALKTVEAERSDKQNLLTELETLQSHLSSLELHCDELRVARQEGSRELLLSRSQSQDQIRALQMQLEDQHSKKNSLDQVIGHLREELERLQSENAEEWGRRERTETEKLNVERDNKKLKMKVDELMERNQKLASFTDEHTSAEMSRLQKSVDSSSGELLELRHQHGRLRKTYAEKCDELTHCQRKADTSDKEVKKLRLRIEELKRDLGKAEDELDESANAIRRIQRTNEELLSQNEGHQVQIEHLTSRLRAVPQTDLMLAFRRHSRGGTRMVSGTEAFPVGGRHEDGIVDVDDDDDDDRPVSSTSEETLPIFDDDDDDDDDDELFGNEIETDV